MDSTISIASDNGSTTLASALIVLSGAISSLSGSFLTSIDTSQLATDLVHLGQNLTKATTAVNQEEAERLLSNATWVASNLELLTSAVGRIPEESRNGTSPDDLVAMVTVGATRFDIFSTWAPDSWAIGLLFLLALLQQLLMRLLLRKKCVERVRQTGLKNEQALMTPESAEAILEHPVRGAIGHGFNMILATIALVLQMNAWNLFIVPEMSMVPEDVKYLYGAIKIVLVGYGAELLFARSHIEIWAHHLLAFGLFFVGEMAQFETQSPKIFRMAQWMLLQATTDQLMYLAMLFFHLSVYVRLQDIPNSSEHGLLSASWLTMVSSAALGFPLKLVPAGFGFYWLGMMWKEMSATGWGRFWLGWCTTLSGVLIVLQMYFCDQAFPIAAHLKARLNGGPLPSHKGPLHRL
ncbi:hypothetical protein T439DRAFT_370603, partial [Meredithblackwellia eburnea MCA 4105]